MAEKFLLCVMLSLIFHLFLGLDVKSEACQRFFRDGLTISFTKILMDEAVSGWKFEIHVSLILYTGDWDLIYMVVLVGFSLENITVNNVSGLLINLIPLKVFKNELDILSYENLVSCVTWNPCACDFMQVLYFIKCLLVDWKRVLQFYVLVRMKNTPDGEYNKRPPPSIYLDSKRCVRFHCICSW